MSKESIEAQKQAARNTNELVDHLIHLLEQDTKRFSFEFCVGGEHSVVNYPRSYPDGMAGAC